MADPVIDNKENMMICKDFCGQCPTFQENKLKEKPPHALFCARGKSEMAEEIVDKGCTCFICPIYKRDKLQGGYFCIYGIEGKK
ncbi:MAG: DUF2769 domain-containing protein [Candidatus Heimdallarchaeota archaeon]